MLAGLWYGAAMRITMVPFAVFALLACDPPVPPLAKNLGPAGDLDVFPTRAFTGIEVDPQLGAGCTPGSTECGGERTCLGGDAVGEQQGNCSCASDDDCPSESLGCANPGSAGGCLIGFTVPAIQHLQPIATSWSAVDDKITVRDLGDGLVIFEARVAGDTTVVVSAPGKDSVEVPITIVEYPSGSAQAASSQYYGALGCAACHDGEQQSDVTSSGIAEHSDAEVLAAIIAGTNSEDGSAIDAPGLHVFDLTQEEQTNMLAFLRWQASKTYPFHDH